MKTDLMKIYPEDWQTALGYINELIKMHKLDECVEDFDETDVILETYGDTIVYDKKGLKSLKYFSDVYLKDLVSTIHLLPVHPYTSDEGYAVSDYLKVRKSLGCWVHVRDLTDHFKLMFDGVFNHTSSSHDWFNGFVAEDSDYEDYYVSDSTFCYDSPRETPMFHTFSGKKAMTTFSKDQVDLNYRNFFVLLEVLHIIGVYINNGASYIRMDAVRYLWKEKGGEEGHLFSLLEVFKQYCQALKPGVCLISEINGDTEKNLPFRQVGYTYCFELTPLILSGLYQGKAAKVNAFLNKVADQSNVINMLSTHDGISMRAVSDLLTDEEVALMRENIKKASGFETIVNDKIYEFNINLLDALTTEDHESDLKRFMMTHFVLLSIQGVPSIYIHSFLGSRGSYPKYVKTAEKRGINRGQIKLVVIEDQLMKHKEKSFVFSEFERLLSLRRTVKCFHPKAEQKVIHIDSRLFMVSRTIDGEEIIALANFSNEVIESKVHFSGKDLLSDQYVDRYIEMAPYEYMWIKRDPS